MRLGLNATVFLSTCTLSPRGTYATITVFPDAASWQSSVQRMRHRLSLARFLPFLTLALVPGMPLHAQTPSCVQPPSGIVSWWPGDANANDIVGGANGLALGGVSFSQSDGFAFNGNNFVVVSNTPALEPSRVSVAAWVQAPASSIKSYRYIVSKELNVVSASYALYMGPNGGLYFYVSTNSGYILSPDGGPGLWNGKPHYVVGTFDGSAVRLFVDGTQVGNGTPTNGAISYATSRPDLFVGTFSGDTSGYFNWLGTVRDLQIFNRALLPSEIQAVFVAGSAGTCRPSSPISVVPTRGGNVGSVTVSLYGESFQNGAQVRLTGVGEPDIPGTNSTVLNASVLTTRFNLSGATPGVRNVVVTNSDNTTITLTGGFTVEQGGAPQVWVDLIGLDQIRIGSAQTYYVACGNRGNVDALVIQCWVSFPSSVNWSATPPSNASLSSTISGSGGVVLGVEVVGVSAGNAAFIPIALKTGTADPFEVSVWSNQQ